ncbi:uncharacterized protein [Periplaneta americana]
MEKYSTLKQDLVIDLPDVTKTSTKDRVLKTSSNNPDHVIDCSAAQEKKSQCCDNRFEDDDDDDEMYWRSYWFYKLLAILFLVVMGSILFPYLIIELFHTQLEADMHRQFRI